MPLLARILGTPPLVWAACWAQKNTSTNTARQQTFFYLSAVLESPIILCNLKLRLFCSLKGAAHATWSPVITAPCSDASLSLLMCAVEGWRWGGVPGALHLVWRKCRRSGFEKSVLSICSLVFICYPKQFINQFADFMKWGEKWLCLLPAPCLRDLPKRSLRCSSS